MDSYVNLEIMKKMQEIATKTKEIEVLKADIRRLELINKENADQEPALCVTIGAQKEGKKVKSLKDYLKIVVETDEENHETIAEITPEDIKVAGGYRVVSCVMSNLSD